MSGQINDGGPAFPNKDELGSMIPGMSLRDWFAGQALAGIMSNPALLDNGDAVTIQWASTKARMAADELLSQLRGNGGDS